MTLMAATTRFAVARRYAQRVVVCTLWAAAPHWDKLVVLILRVFTSDTAAVDREGACGDERGSEIGALT
jgi:hypothetical protein